MCHCFTPCLILSPDYGSTFETNFNINCPIYFGLFGSLPKIPLIGLGKYPQLGSFKNFSLIWGAFSKFSL